MNQFEQEIQEKEAELRNVKAEQERLSAIGNDNPSLMQDLTDKGNALSNRLNELYAIRGQQQKEHEERVSQSVSGYDEYIESLNYDGVSFRQLIGESEYQLVSIDLKRGYAAQAEQFSKQITAMQEKFNEQLRAANDREEQLQRQNTLLQQANDKQAEELQAERLGRAQAEQYRDNAITQLDEARQQIDQLKEWNDDLRKQANFGVRDAIKVVDTEEDERKKKELMDRLKRERTIYGLEWTDAIKQSRYKAKLAANDEVIEFPWTEKSKYTIIDESEVGPFRTQYAEPERNHADITLDAPELSKVDVPEVTAAELDFSFRPSYEIAQVQRNDAGMDGVPTEVPAVLEAGNAQAGLTVEQKVEILWQERQQRGMVKAEAA